MKTLKKEPKPLVTNATTKPLHLHLIIRANVGAGTRLLGSLE